MQNNTLKPNLSLRGTKQSDQIPKLRFKEFTDEWKEKMLGINSPFGEVQ